MDAIRSAKRRNPKRTGKIWNSGWLEPAIWSAQYAIRQLLRSPGFTLATVAIIALGIGITTAMYSVVYAVILQPLPFAQPRRLVAVSAKPWNAMSFPTVEDWRRGSLNFESIAAYADWLPRIESSAGVGYAHTLLVSQNFLGTLNAALQLGHDFTQSGNETDCFTQVIVTAGYWKRLGGGGILGNRTLELDRQTYEIVGVLAPKVTLEEIEILDKASIIVPIGCNPKKSPYSRHDLSFRAIGRMRSGVSLKEAAAELETKQKNLIVDHPNDYPPATQPTLVSLADTVSGSRTRTALFATLAACGMLLLVACANLSNLLLARNMRRRREFAIRTSLGAQSLHLVQQIVAENVTLSIAGAGIGTLISLLLVRMMQHISVVHLPRLEHARLNMPVLIFAGSIAMLNLILLTLLPVVRSLRVALLPDLTSGGSRSSSASFGLLRGGRLLVTAQLAIAFVLVAGCGWMTSTVFILLHQPLGFEPDRLLIATTDLRGHVRNATIPPAEILAALDQALLDARSVPGVTAVAAANDKPLGGRVNRWKFCSDVHPEECQRPAATAPDMFLVTPAYFSTVGQELYRGRIFNSADDGRTHVAIVNRALADQQWPGQNPISHRIYTGDLHAWATVVGEVGDVHSYSLEQAPMPNLYLPEADNPDTSMTIFLRTLGDPTLLDEAVRRVLQSDSKFEVGYVESMPELMSHQVAVQRFSTWVIAIFACLALSLAVFGTYALLAYEVSMREREIGIRIALGSSRSGIISLLMRQEFPWLGAGLVLGLFGAALVGLLLRTEFYHAKAASIPVLLSSFVLLLIPAVASVILPGRRASRLDPSSTLRQE